MDPFSILVYDRALCTKWAEVMVAAQSRGYRIECADAWIAATVLLYRLPLVTHNRGDYRGVAAEQDGASCDQGVVNSGVDWHEGRARELQCLPLSIIDIDGQRLEGPDIRVFLDG